MVKLAGEELAGEIDDVSCPISFGIFLDPVRVQHTDGVVHPKDVFERVAIADWIQAKPIHTCPFCQKSITAYVVPADDMKQKTAILLEQHPELHGDQYISIQRRGQLDQLKDLIEGNNTDDAIRLLTDNVYLRYTPILDGQTALHLFAANTNLRGIRALLQLGTDIDKIDEQGNTALSLLALNKEIDGIDELIASDADINLVGSSVLYLLALEKEADVIQKLIALGVKIDKVNKHGETALHLAAKKGDYDACELLVRLGASFESLNQSKKKPAEIATETAKLFFEEYIDRQKEMISVFIERLDVIQSIALLKINNELINDEFVGGLTPLQSFAASGSVEGISQLIELNVDINLVDTAHGQTALHLAALYGHVECCELLIANGAYIVLDHLQQSPVMIATNAAVAYFEPDEFKFKAVRNQFLNNKTHEAYELMIKYVTEGSDSAQFVSCFKAETDDAKDALPVEIESLDVEQFVSRVKWLNEIEAGVRAYKAWREANAKGSRISRGGGHWYHGESGIRRANCIEEKINYLKRNWSDQSFESFVTEYTQLIAESSNAAHSLRNMIGDTFKVDRGVYLDKILKGIEAYLQWRESKEPGSGWYHGQSGIDRAETLKEHIKELKADLKDKTFGEFETLYKKTMAKSSNTTHSLASFIRQSINAPSSTDDYDDAASDASDLSNFK